MPPKKHFKTLTSDFSSQALLGYLQRRDSNRTRQSNSPSHSNKGDQRNFISYQSPMMRKELLTTTNASKQQLLSKASSPHQKIGFYFQQPPTDISQEKKLKLNLKLKQNLHSEISVSQEYHNSPIVNKVLQLVSSPFKQNTLKQVGSLKSLNNNKQKPAPTHLKQGSEDLTKKQLSKQVSGLLNSNGQHMRMSSMNDELSFQPKIQKQKQSVGDISDKLLNVQQLKDKLEQISLLRKGSEEFTQKIIQGNIWKQSNTQLNDLLKSKSNLPINQSQQSKPSSEKKKREETIAVILSLKNGKHKIEIGLQNRTIQNLLEVCQKYTDQTMIGIKTSQLSVPLDYLLSNLSMPLFILTQFPLQPIKIEPVFPVPRELRPTIGLKDFDFIRCIGSGGFSKVYLVRERSQSKYYAMKLIEKRAIFQQNKQSIIHNERMIMAGLEHPFVVKMHYAFESLNYLVFVLEYCSGGELFFLLRQVKRMSEEQAFFYFSQICLGMKCLHDNNIIYRDIKPENILIDMHGNLRIADFGLSKPEMGVEDVAYSFCGSPEYMAPEMLLKQGHNYQLDLYCLGALLYELVTGLPPFYSKNTEEIYRRILNTKLTFPEQLHLSPLIKDLLSRMLAKNPKHRITSIDHVLKDPWMLQYKTDNYYRDLLQGRIAPPFQPDLFRFNFDEEEFSKGEAEFLQHIKMTQQSVQENFPREYLLKGFYYDYLQKPRSNDFFYEKISHLVDTGGTYQLNLNQAKKQDENSSFSHRSQGNKKNGGQRSNQRMNTLEDHPNEPNSVKNMINNFRMQTEQEALKMKKQ